MSRYQLRRFFGSANSQGEDCYGEIIDNLDKKTAFEMISLGMEYGVSPRDLAILYEAVGPGEWKKYLSEKFNIDIFLGSGLSINDYDVAMDLSWSLNEKLWDGSKIRVPNRHRGKHYLELERKSDKLLVFDRFIKFTPDENTFTIELSDLKDEFLFILQMEESLRNNPNFMSMAIQNIPRQIEDARQSLMRSEE